MLSGNTELARSMKDKLLEDIKNDVDGTTLAKIDSTMEYIIYYMQRLQMDIFAMEQSHKKVISELKNDNWRKNFIKEHGII